MAPSPNFLLLIERTTYEKQQMTLHDAPNTPYINTSYVCGFWQAGTVQIGGQVLQCAGSTRGNNTVLCSSEASTVF